MKKSFLFVFGAGALGYLAYSYGLFDKAIEKVRGLAPQVKQQLGMEEEQEATKERRRRPRSTRKRRPSHWTSEGLLDLNSASQEELQNLKGIGPVLAERIVENRPYLTKIDLVGRMVIPDAAYEAIKHDITVRAIA